MKFPVLCLSFSVANVASKEDWKLFPSCFAFELYYGCFRSRDHSFAMDFIKVVLQTSPTFRERKLIYLHCFDLGAQESVQFDQFPCLQVKLVLGHVSFPEKIAERRMCCFLFQEKLINLLKNCQAPVLFEVINSCNMKVSFSAIHFLVFGLAFNCSFILCST